ncbi:MAG: UDP-N-acetylmuramate dehydrogenase [Clostridiaceae bacterium]|nr:UDP-N-acetylmuramate dehydrogenase [Clostridiaceae bacterium]
MQALDYQTLFSSFSDKKLFFDHSLKKFTTFRVGGNADVLLLPSDLEEIQLALDICQHNDIPVQILGRGSNVLISDKGIRGLTIYMHSNFNRVEVKGNKIIANAGVSLASLAALAAKNSLTGLEFASGIPGSLGGAILMNASSYDSEMKNIVQNSIYMNKNNEIKKLHKEEHQFAYRKSIYSTGNNIILSAELQLEDGNRFDIYDKIADFQVQRRNSQPLEKHSGGSAFKRPTGYFAGKLISDAGLKGYRSQNAGVSEKHAGFIVNHGNATASEINAVFKHVKEEVKKQFDIDLEPEVKWLGDWTEEEIAWKL